jgi:hypothetical protein
MNDTCIRCKAPAHPSLMFCPECGKAYPGRVGMRISTDESRGRALDEVDRLVGLHDSDELAEAKAAEFLTLD